LKQKFNSLVLVIVFAIAVVLCLTRCQKETEEDKIKNMVDGIQMAVREKDAGTVLRHLSKTYHDPQGNNYDDVKGLLSFYFMNHRQVNAYVPNLDISIENNAARASFQAVLTGAGESVAEAGTGMLPEALGIYAFELVMQKESGDWKITSAKWEHIGEGPLPKQ
jgi:hypothetical protein